MVLHFSAAQMEQLGRDMHERFERDCVRLLRRQQPEKAAQHDDATLLAFVRHGVQRATLVQVNRVSDVVDWLDLMLLLGPRFDENPQLLEVHRVLADLEVPAVVRLAEARRLADAWLRRVAPAQPAVGSA
jgi:hypothetical protein